MGLQELKDRVLDSLAWDTFVCVHIPNEILCVEDICHEFLEFLHELPNLSRISYISEGTLSVEIELTKPLKSPTESITYNIVPMTPEQLYNNIIANLATSPYVKVQFPEYFTVSDCFLVQHWLRDSLRSKKEYWFDVDIYSDEWDCLNISAELIPK